MVEDQESLAHRHRLSSRRAGVRFLSLPLFFFVAGASWLGLARGLDPQRPIDTAGTLPPPVDEKPSSVIKIENRRGTLKDVNLEKRTVTVADSRGETVYTFPTAAGREQIHLSKKVAKTLGKKAVRLEDVHPGSQVKVAYYPALGTVMDLIIEELPR